MNKNDIIELDITDISSEGSGIGKHCGMAVFVPLTAVGDRALVRIVKLKKNYAFGKLEKILTPSGDRITPDCDVFSKCGGCVFRHISYQSECEWKASFVGETMRRIGKTDVCPQPIISAHKPERYRNKAQYPVNSDCDAGFYAHNSHRIIPCVDCRLQPEEFAAALRAFSSWAKQCGASAYNEETKSGLLRHFYLRKGAQTGELMAVVIANGNALPESDLLVSSLKEALGEGLKGVILNVNTKHTNVVLGDKNILLYGRDYIYDILCGVKVRLSAAAFYQVNHEMAQLLYERVAQYAKPDSKNILDLYCGAGTIGLSMAKRAKSIMGVEIVEAAVADAKENARENGIKNARFICADAALAAENLRREGYKADVVILDPPRKGCEQKLLETVAFAFAPKRIVYVSCSPATLARDTAYLTENGYKLLEYTPVDLFPRTAHVETVALFVKN